jgi:hypothetical protein
MFVFTYLRIYTNLRQGRRDSTTFVQTEGHDFVKFGNQYMYLGLVH